MYCTRVDLWFIGNEKFCINEKSFPCRANIAVSTLQNLTENKVKKYPSAPSLKRCCHTVRNRFSFRTGIVFTFIARENRIFPTRKEEFRNLKSIKLDIRCWKPFPTSWFGSRRNFAPRLHFLSLNCEPPKQQSMKPSKELLVTARWPWISSFYGNINDVRCRLLRVEKERDRCRVSPKPIARH